MALECEFEFERKKGEGELLPPLPVYKHDDIILFQCRICHEEEPASMESPCSCSGSLKYAHRRCVQRWCDEKGSTICEICLRNFEPGYMIRTPPTPKKAVTIRGSLEIRRQNHGAIDVTNLNVECSTPPVRHNASSCCRSLAITFTALLLLKHLMDVLFIAAADEQTLVPLLRHLMNVFIVAASDHQYAFNLLVMFSLRAMGILLPAFVLLRLISAIQHGQRLYQLEQIQLRRGEERTDMSSSDEENPRHHTIQILS